MAALVKKYGTAEGDASYAQYGRVGTDASSNCNGAAASSTAPAASQQITAATRPWPASTPPTAAC
jgi:hypothetical protein